jgi:phenylacetate-CoA ligase
MPFIRYENGDDATILTNKCSCGVNSQLMSSPEGRTVDTITLRNGNKVHGVFFTDLLFELGITTDIISRFQVVQHENGAVDFKLEADKDISPDMLKKIESATIRFIDSVKVIPMGSIPNEPNGKFRYIKQEFYREN